jgi:DNA-binding PadR family transcriptional regulator
MQKDAARADPELLMLFPSLNFRSPAYDPMVKKGLHATLAVVLVAAENGKVNNYLLVKDYQVGGETRRRVLPLLHDLGLLRRRQETSEKRVKRFSYTLTDKGVILCAAFPKILQSKTFPSLIRTCVLHANLAQTMLVLFLQPIDGKNRLLAVLRELSHKGLNIEQASEDDLAQRLLEADEMISRTPVREAILKAFAHFVDFHAEATVKARAQSKQSILELIDLAWSNPELAKRYMRLVVEVLDFLRSADFQVWWRLSRGASKHINRLTGVGRKIVFNHMAKPWADLDRLEKLWSERGDIFNEIRGWLREDSYALLSALDLEDQR